MKNDSEKSSKTESVKPAPKQTWSAWNRSILERTGLSFRHVGTQPAQIKPVEDENNSSLPDDIITVGFVGESGTGKSHRAVEVARREGIYYIIDDGLLIGNNRVLEGKSAKLTNTRVGALKRAVFFDEEERSNMMRAIRINQPKSILILGTSDGMVEKITARLDLPPVSKIIRIEDVASVSEIKQAKQTRRVMGKHVIPVATFELKRDFSGLLIDSLKWMRWKGNVIPDYDVERSVVRPTFSMLGKYKISEKAIKQLVVKLTDKVEGVEKVHYVYANNHNRGIYIRVEVEVEYGKNIRSIIQQVQQTINRDVSHMTALYIYAIDVVVSRLVFPKAPN